MKTGYMKSEDQTTSIYQRSDMEEEMRKEAVKIVAKECEKNSDNNQVSSEIFLEQEHCSVCAPIVGIML